MAGGKVWCLGPVVPSGGCKCLVWARPGRTRKQAAKARSGRGSRRRQGGKTEMIGARPGGKVFWFGVGGARGELGGKVWWHGACHTPGQSEINWQGLWGRGPESEVSPAAEHKGPGGGSRAVAIGSV